jgi:hypothetical protein
MGIMAPGLITDMVPVDTVEVSGRGEVIMVGEAGTMEVVEATAAIKSWTSRENEKCY